MSVERQIASRDNPLLVRLRRLVHDGAAYRRTGQVWIEGEHLCRALRDSGGMAAQAVISDDAWQHAALRDLANHAAQVAVVPQSLYAGISSLDSPTGIGYVVDLAEPEPPSPAAASIVLDRIQDPGNVGSILRSASAFGVKQVIALKGTVALWAPKVLRAGMGAHFGLRLVEGVDESALDRLDVPLLATTVHDGTSLPDADLPWPCAWVLSHEGQGIATSLLDRCTMRLRIPQPGGEESLNVAAAAAVCLYESSRQRAAMPAAGTGAAGSRRLPG